MDRKLQPPEPRFSRPIPVSLSWDTKLKLEALATILQQTTSAVLELAVLTYITSLPEADGTLVQSLATRARQSLSLHSEVESQRFRTSNTVNGKAFRYRGSIDDGLEILFENSPPLRITAESIQRINEEIKLRKGRALMGAIFSPLMPNSIGEAIQKKYRLTPINLSYVVPLLRERNLVKAFKEGRTWYVEAIHAAARGRT